MAPLTRSRATDNTPNDLMAEYYGQRANAGLIISEGTSPSPNGLGYARIPGIYNEAQVEGWKKVTDAVHKNGGKIFVQLMHTGRVSHPNNMQAGTKIIAPSAVTLSGEMYTDSDGLQPYPEPLVMDSADIEEVINEFVQASKNAISAGFDGVEMHAANGYLIDQFLNTASNQRDDEYGGSIENRSRFALEVSTRVAAAIGADKTGIRISPFGVFSDMAVYEGMEDAYAYLAAELGKLKLAYIHVVDHSSMGTPEVPESTKLKIKAGFGGPVIASGGMDKAKAEATLNDNKGDLISFGRPYISNPDLVFRLENDVALAAADQTTFYTPGAAGYTDYPTAN
jgi:N-ethylmaleimide reductase